jgi:hypothetical protein
MHVESSREPPGEYLSHHLGRLKSWGLDQAIERGRTGSEVEFAGVLDADIDLGRDHYQSLIAEFDRQPDLGVSAAAHYVLKEDGQPCLEPWQRIDHPWGPTLFLRMACLEAIGGLPPYAAQDSIASVRAWARSWRCEVFPHIRAEHRRATASRGSVRSGYRRFGQRTWFLGHHPICVAGRTLGYSLRSPEAGAAFLTGWLLEAVRRGPRLPDPEVRAYFRSVRPRELLGALVGRGPRYLKAP